MQKQDGAQDILVRLLKHTMLGILIRYDNGREIIRESIFEVLGPDESVETEGVTSLPLYRTKRDQAGLRR